MENRLSRAETWAALSVVLVLAACASPTAQPSATPRPATNTPTSTVTQAATETPTVTLTPKHTLTPTETLTPTSTQTATPEPLTVVAVEGNANCRWGPGTVYIEYGVFHEGDRAAVEGRDYSNSWAYIQPANIDRHCWVALSAVEINGDIRSVAVVIPDLSPRGDVPVPGGITAKRNGRNVTFSWNAVPSAPEVGYLLEVIQCVNGFAINASYATEKTSITLQDGTDCSVKSEGTLRSKNKLGYSYPVTLPWP